MITTHQTVLDTYLEMREKLRDIVPDVELLYKAELVHEIRHLKEERGAVILGHNYMEPALYHTIPDFTGDSLELSRRAAETDKDPIVFCGVRFMAETAKILPGRQCSCPLKAGCSLAAASRRGRESSGPDTRRSCGDMRNTAMSAEATCAAPRATQESIESLVGHGDLSPDEYLAKNVAREKQAHHLPGSRPRPASRRIRSSTASSAGRGNGVHGFPVDDIRRCRHPTGGDSRTRVQPRVVEAPISRAPRQ
jgi:quinolinate synthase